TERHEARRHNERSTDPPNRRCRRAVDALCFRDSWFGKDANAPAKSGRVESLRSRDTLPGVGKQDNADLLGFLEVFAAGIQAIALDLRDLVWDLYPTSNELIYD